MQNNPGEIGIQFWKNFDLYFGLNVFGQSVRYLYLRFTCRQTLQMVLLGCCVDTQICQSVGSVLALSARCLNGVNSQSSASCGTATAQETRTGPTPTWPSPRLNFGLFPGFTTLCVCVFFQILFHTNAHIFQLKNILTHWFFSFASLHCYLRTFWKPENIFW